MSTSVEYEILLKNGQFTKAAQESERAIRDVGGAVDGIIKEGGNIDTMLKKVGTAAAGFFTIKSAVNFAKQIVSVREEVQALEISFSTLLGSSERSAQLLNELKEFAVSTPLQLNDLAKGAQTLLSFNVEAEKIMPTLKAIGDISMGDAEKLQSLTLAFSQMSSTGKLMGQDLLQMINAGFNPLTEISRQTGKSVAELKEEMSKGAISAQMVSDAFISATSEGGKFYNMLAQQSKSVQGAFSNLQGAIYDMMNELGEKIQGPLSSTLNIMMKVVQNYEKLGKVAADIIVTYGAYKAAVLAVTAAENLRYQATLAQMAGLTKMQALTTILKEKTAALNKTMLANPYVAVATAIAAMAVAIWRISRNSSEAERNMKKFNKEMEKHKAAVDGALVTYDFFISKLNSAKKGTDEYRVAVKNITDQYGDYLDKLGIEADRLKEIKSLQVNLRAEIEKTEKLKAKSALLTGAEDQYNDMVSNARDLIKKNLGKLYEEGSAEYVNAYNKVLELIQKGTDINTADFKYWEFFEGAKKGKMNQKIDIIGAVNTINRAGRIYTQQVNSILTVMDASEDQVGDRLSQLRRALAAAETPEQKAEIQRQINELTKATEPTRNKKYWEDEKKRLESQLEAMENTAENKAKMEEIKAQIRKAQEEIDKYDPNKAASAADKAEDEAAKRRKAQERYARTEIAYNKALEAEKLAARREAEQAEINLKEEGSEKRLRQINLDYDRQMDAIKAKENEMLERLRDLKEEEWNAANPSAAESGRMFDRESVTADMLDEEQKAQLAAMENAAEKAKEYAIKVSNEQKEALLSQYADLQTKIEAIKKKYDKLRKEAAGNDVATANINKSQSSEIANLIMNTFKADEAIGKMAESISSLGKAARGAIADKLYKILQFAQNSRIKMVDAQSVKEFAELNGVSEELLNSLINNDAALEEFKKYVSDIGKQAKQIDTLKDAVDNYRKALDKAKSGEILDTDALEQAKGLLNDMIKALADNILDELNTIGDVMTQLGDLLGDDNLTTAGEFLNDFTSNIQAAEEGAQAWGGWWGAIIGGVSDLIPKIVKWMNAGTTKSLDDVEKMLSHTESMINYWREISNHSNWQANDYTQAFDTERIQELLDKIKQARKRVITDVADLGSSFLGRGWSVQKIKTLIESIKKGSNDITNYVNEIMGNIADGVGISSKEAFDKMMSSYDKRMEELQDKLEVLLRNPKKNAEEINELLILLGETAQEKIDALLEHAESVVGVTSQQLFDDLFGMISDAFDAGKDSIDDFASYFNKTIANMIKNQVLTRLLADRIQQYIEDIAWHYDEGHLTGENAADYINWLRGYGEEIVKDGLDALEALRPIFEGLSVAVDDASTLSGSIKGITAEQAGMLAGQMNAMRTAQLQQVSLLTEQLDALNNIGNNTRYIREIYNYIRSGNAGGNLNRAYGQS